MATTHIDTRSIPRVRTEGQGEVAEIIGREICGAENVTGFLRWLYEGDRFAAESLADAHQLFYLMEGEGVIELESRPYQVKKGAGLHLGPAEAASISHVGQIPLKLFHLIVPIKHDR